MSKFIDITGQKFNMLTVISRAENAPNGVARWNCVCDCGNKTVVRGANLKNGAVKSCGCLVHRESLQKTHGKSHTRLYYTWAGMKARCNNPKSKSYKDYGARGIKVCNEWEHNFQAFYDWAIASGYTDELTIERIDNSIGYSPQNCMWITKSEQSAHRRSCVIIEYDGRQQNLMQWCNELGLNYKRVHDRIYACGMSFEDAISKPIEVKKRNKELRKKYG